MKIRLSIYILLFFSISFFADETIIKEKVETILPKGAEIESIVQSEFPGIYKVYYGDIQPIYVSDNGDYFIFGDMFKISKNGILNITDFEANQRRLEIIDNINSNELISFPSNMKYIKLQYLLMLSVVIVENYMIKLMNIMTLVFQYIMQPFQDQVLVQGLLQKWLVHGAQIIQKR